MIQCKKCSTTNKDSDKFCQNCDAVLGDELKNEKIYKKEDVVVIKEKKDGFATASVVLGILSIFLWEFSIIPILAIIFGIIGIKKTLKNEKIGLSSAITGLILGILFLIVRIYNLYN